MKHRWNTDFSKPVRAGIFVASPAINGESSVRSDIIGNVDGICRPDGAENYFDSDFYKYAAPDGAGSGATPETATGTGALPSKVPAVRPKTVWGGRTGQRARSRGATADRSPRREPWVKRTKRIQPRRGRKKITGGWFSVAPSGAWMVLTTRPTVSPWATICHASGALVGTLRCDVPAGALNNKGTKEQSFPDFVTWLLCC